jgi:transposase
MRKHDQGSAAAAGARRATGAAAERDRPVGITAARASHWRAQFLAAGQAGLKSRATDARDEDHRRLQAKIGELLMETELLYAKVDQLEASGPLARRRSTR